jgi:hypothetical protein
MEKGKNGILLKNELFLRGSNPLKNIDHHLPIGRREMMILLCISPSRWHYGLSWEHFEKLVLDL